MSKKSMGFLLMFVVIVACVYFLLPPKTVSVAPPVADYKVAIVTNTVSQNEEEYRSAQEMVAKYGDRIVHVMWPDNFMAEPEQMVSVISKLAYDKEIKAVVINQAVPGTNPAIDKLREARRDVFIVYASPQENPPEIGRAHV